MIDQHTREGRFLGGYKFGQDYSDKAIPAFYLGRLVKKQGEWTIEPGTWDSGFSREPRIRSVRENIFWRHVDGRKLALFEGGYKAFRRLTGRQTGHVDYTITGDLLRGLDWRVNAVASGIQIRIGVFNHRSEIAGYLDKQREFLGLTPDEETRAFRLINRVLSDSIG